jgi:serine/threonine-protein kinase
VTHESPPESVALGTIIGQRYRIERKLGAGGMGEVYLVQHVHTDKRFALKVLHTTIISDTNALERFRREARTPARIESEHVVDVTDADAAPELGGAPFIIMEYLRGEDLDHYLDGRGALDPREVVLYLKQVARALDKAHTLGIIHRDLKPENIFLTRREDGTPHVKVLDFGIAKFTSHATSDLVKKTATSPGEIFGTPLYMAPEQAKGESSAISPQTDVWALGLIAHRMLTGTDFWDAQTLTALIAQIVYEPMQKPSAKGFDLGPGYDAWFLKCCSRDPHQRWATAGEAVAMLGQALGLGEAELGPELARISRSTALPTSHAHAQTHPSGSVSITPRVASGTQALSKTELQLAQTGTIPTPTPPQDRGSVLKVAAAALVVGALGAGLWVWSRPSAGPNGRADAALPGPLPTASPEVPAREDEPKDGPTVEPADAPTATPTATPSASASAETTTTAEPSAAPTSKPAGSVKPGPTTRPPTTATTAASPAPSATSTATPAPTRPPVDDPLGSRR